MERLTIRDGNEIYVCCGKRIDITEKEIINMLAEKLATYEDAGLICDRHQCREQMRRSDPMKRKRYLFHVTDPENLPSILLGGLKRGGGIRQAAAVYLSEKPLSWYQPGLDILRVDVSGLDGIKATTFLPDSDEVLFWGDIPAWKATKGGWRPRFELVTNKYVKMDGGVNDAE